MKPRVLELPPPDPTRRQDLRRCFMEAASQRDQMSSVVIVWLREDGEYGWAFTHDSETRMVGAMEATKHRILSRAGLCDDADR